MKHTVLLFILIISSASTLKGQEGVNEAHLRNDLGFFFNTPSGLPSVEYRLAVNSNFKLRFGLDYVIENTNTPFLGSGRIIFASDSLVQHEYQWGQNLKPSFRIGFDKQTSVKYISVGADLQVRYTQQSIAYVETNTRLNENGNWEQAQINFNEPVSTKSIDFHYLMPALRANITAQFPLGDRFLLSVYYAGLIGPNFFIKETNRNDPQNEIQAPLNYTLDAESFAGVGVRYLFNEKQ